MKGKCQKIYEKITKEQFIEKLRKAGYSKSYIEHYLDKYDCKFKESEKKSSE